MIIEELDKRALEEFWICLDHNRAEVKRKQIQRLNEEPPKPQEGRKLYATKFGEKYHFDKNCKGFNGRPNFEWKSCMICKGQTERILDLSNSGSSSSTEVRATDDTLVFDLKGSDYHAEDCTERKKLARGSTDKKTMCQLCAREERFLVWARGR